MKKMKSQTMPVEGVMIDDHFKLGGKMYRICGVDTNDFGEWIIKFYPIAKPKKRSRVNTLILNRNTPFKVYNQ